MQIQTKDKLILETENGILDWLGENKIRNEKGDLIEFDSHPFLIDIYDDNSQNLTVMKAAQVGMSTAEILKLLWGVKNKGIDAIYVLPTDTDVRNFVGSKVNRIIANNPILQEWTKDKDSVEQKQVGNNLVHFRGSWSQKMADTKRIDSILKDIKLLWNKEPELRFGQMIVKINPFLRKYIDEVEDKDMEYMIRQYKSKIGGKENEQK